MFDRSPCITVACQGCLQAVRWSSDWRSDGASDVVVVGLVVLVVANVAKRACAFRCVYGVWCLAAKCKYVYVCMLVYINIV